MSLQWNKLVSLDCVFTVEAKCALILQQLYLYPMVIANKLHPPYCLPDQRWHALNKQIHWQLVGQVTARDAVCLWYICFPEQLWPEHAWLEMFVEQVCNAVFHEMIQLGVQFDGGVIYNIVSEGHSSRQGREGPPTDGWYRCSAQ